MYFLIMHFSGLEERINNIDFIENQNVRFKWNYLKNLLFLKQL